MGRQSIWEYLRVVYARYHRADRRTKQKMLDESCANTRYHRKHALRLLNGPPPSRDRPRPAHPPQRRPLYGRALVSVLKAIWRTARYPWSVRLKVLIPLSKNSCNSEKTSNPGICRPRDQTLRPTTPRTPRASATSLLSKQTLSSSKSYSSFTRMPEPSGSDSSLPSRPTLSSSRRCSSFNRMSSRPSLRIRARQARAAFRCSANSLPKCDSKAEALLPQSRMMRN